MSNILDGHATWADSLAVRSSPMREEAGLDAASDGLISYRRREKSIWKAWVT